MMRGWHVARTRVLFITPDITPSLREAIIAITHEKGVTYFAESRASSGGPSTFAVCSEYHGSEVRMVRHLIMDVLFGLEPNPRIFSLEAQCGEESSQLRPLHKAILDPGTTCLKNGTDKFEWHKEMQSIFAELIGLLADNHLPAQLAPLPRRRASETISTPEGASGEDELNTGTASL